MILATSNAVYRLAKGDAETIFNSDNIRAVTRTDNAVYIARDGELTRIDHDGATAYDTGIEDEIASVAVLNDEPLTALLGTDEGAQVYRFVGGATSTKVDAFDRLEARKEWYTPWGGPPAVRCFATTDDGWVYADIHVGSIMRSADEGASWEPVTPDLHPDVHQVATSPVMKDRVYANTANAVYVSEDRGATWTHRREGLSARYGRAIAVHPEDPDLILATVSQGPRGGEARLFRSEDAGATWQHVQEGFPESAERNIDTHQLAFSADGTAWAAVGDRLYAGRDRAKRWEVAWTAPEAIRYVVG
ncbi:MAG: hypothetical protein O3A46_05555 [Candidatus Poribacteria bacterium]|nr:hypothetical protein [Candidatus Poribacteria bacterium]